MRLLKIVGVLVVLLIVVIRFGPQSAPSGHPPTGSAPNLASGLGSPTSIARALVNATNTPQSQEIAQDADEELLDAALTSTSVPTEAPTFTPPPEPTKSPKPTKEPRAKPTKAPQPTPTLVPLDSRCEPVPDQILQNLAVGLVDRDTSLRAGQAVRSRDHPKMWFVAADLQGPGLEGENEIGIWATNSIDPNNPQGFIGAEATAREFTDWDTGGDNPFSINDDGIALSEECTKAMLAND